MAVTTRANDRNDAGTPPGDPPQRRFVLTKGRVATIIVLSYLAASTIAAAVFYTLGPQDQRASQVTVAFAIIAAVLCIRSLVIVLRRPSYPRPDVA